MPAKKMCHIRDPLYTLIIEDLVNEVNGDPDADADFTICEDDDCSEPVESEKNVDSDSGSTFGSLNGDGDKLAEFEEYEIIEGMSRVEIVDPKSKADYYLLKSQE
ncbi:unnamed protein product, partial [Brachionus calyciflorus]